MDETIREKADRLRKKAEAKRPEILAKADALRKSFESPEKREHFDEVKARLSKKLK